VKPGEWSTDLGEAYQVLSDLRDKGDYGGVMWVSREEATTSVEKAARIVEAVRRSCPELDRGPSNSVNQEK
jgi:uncharacterized protein (UPF0332 family)